MTWREKTIVRILLMVAQVLALKDRELCEAIGRLSTHIQATAPSEAAA